MDMTDIDTTLASLQDKVNGFTSVSGTHGGSHREFSFNFRSPLLLWGSVPVIFLILLCVWKPKVVTLKVEGGVEGDPPTYRLSPKKVLVAVALLSACVGGGVVGWTKYRETTK